MHKPEEDWLERLVETHFGLFYSIAWQMLHDAHAAEDAVSESVLKALRKAPGMTDTSNAKAWLATIVRNTSLDMLRKRKQTIPLQDVAEATEICGQVQHIDNDTLESLSAAMMALPEDQREIIQLRFLDELSPKEIGQRLSLKPSAVSMRLRRSLEKLRENQALQHVLMLED